MRVLVESSIIVVHQSLWIGATIVFETKGGARLAGARSSLGPLSYQKMRCRLHRSRIPSSNLRLGPSKEKIALRTNPLFDVPNLCVIMICLFFTAGLNGVVCEKQDTLLAVCDGMNGLVFRVREEAGEPIGFRSERG